MSPLPHQTAKQSPNRALREAQQQFRGRPPYGPSSGARKLLSHGLATWPAVTLDNDPDAYSVKSHASTCSMPRYVQPTKVTLIGKAPRSAPQHGANDKLGYNSCECNVRNRSALSCGRDIEPEDDLSLFDDAFLRNALNACQNPA